MNNKLLWTGAASLVVLLTVSGCEKLKSTSATPTTGAPVAVVNGKSISRNTFDYYVQGVTGKPASEATDEQKAQLLDNLIRGELIAAQAEKSEVGQAPETQAVLELSRLNALQQAASAAYLKDRKPTDEEMKAEYDQQISSLPASEYHARHILVANEEFAKKLIEQLDKGARFEDVAKKESMDPSKANGGDLGWFTPDRMVPAFAAAVTGLAKGTYTKTPVQTQYGWHIIRLEETRAMSPPTLDSVKDRLSQIVAAKKFKAYADELAKTARIEKKL
jgi:peptidyl-prolyl cis-trans isomerase C